jgi:hypothetical protein
MLNVVPINEPSAKPEFDDFWLLWPQARRLEKKSARSVWASMSNEQRVAAIVAVASWRRVWATVDPAFIVYPHRWLRNERWEDELPLDTVTSASHSPAQLPEQGAKAVMPDHVRALLAKMRAR